jgi:hypothetical protein
LPSPSQFLDYLLSPPKTPKKKPPKTGLEKEGEGVRVSEMGSPVRVGKGVGFRESFGGTFYEIDE